MNVLVKYPFRLNSTNFYNKSYDIGNFDNSYWNFRFQSGYMQITRSNTSQSFAVIVNLSILHRNQTYQNECFLKTINDGEAIVPFRMKTNKGIEDMFGCILIIELPVTSSKETKGSIDSLTECIHHPLLEHSKPTPLLSEDLLRLLDNPDSFPDATFKCGAQEILVHRAILSARSPVFSAMFKNEMQESNRGIVVIVDIEPNVLHATLKYMYSGKTDHINDGIAGEVLFAANKYELEELKKVCIERLKSNMSVDNVFRILFLGDLHDESLKTQAMEFVCKCDLFSNLKKTEGWKLLQSENPGLAMEVLLYVVEFAQKCATENSALKNSCSA